MEERALRTSALWPQARTVHGQFLSAATWRYGLVLVPALQERGRAEVREKHDFLGGENCVRTGEWLANCLRRQSPAWNLSS